MMNFSRMKQGNCAGVLSIKPQKDIAEYDTLKRGIFRNFSISAGNSYGFPLPRE